MQVIQKIKAKLNNSPRRVILDTRKKCSNNSTCRIINNRTGDTHRGTPKMFCVSKNFGGKCVAGPVLSLLLPVALGTICLSYSAYAEIGSSDVDFSLSVDATPSLEIVLAGDGLTTSPTSLGLNIKPNIDGTPVFGYSDLDVTVATSNATGYYLNFSTTNADGSLRTTSSSTLSTLADTGTFTCTTATASTCSFTTNRWGYKLAQDDATSYIAAPGSDGTKIDEIYTKTNGVTSNLRVGAKVDSSLTAGNYSTTMSFAATAHPTTYGIYYNAGAAGNSASGLPGNQSGALNNSATTTVTLSSDTPTWTGHTFNKWCLGTVNSTSYQNDTCTGTEYSPGDTITFSMDDVVSVTLKAMWNINSYSIKFGTANGISKVTLDGQECTAAVSGTGCTKTLIYGKSYSLVATLSTGYSLSTWSATAGSVANNTASTTYAVGAGNATITPGATLDSYEVTVTFVDGANQVLFENSTYGNVTATASSPTVSLYYNQPYTATMSFSDNYEFDSWASGTNTSVSNTSLNPTTITLTGTGNGTITANGKSSKIYMQTMSISQCTSAGVTVYDSRNESVSYTVKLISLNGTNTCWMMSNLKLPGGTALTTSDSNVTSSYTLPSDTGSSGWVDDFCKPYMATAGGEYYYNWPAATARTNSTSSTSGGCSNDTGNSVGDICPKGWRLPVYSGEIDNSTWLSNLQANGSLTTTGGFNSGSQYGVGRGGYWWTSTRLDDLSARNLASNGSTAKAGGDVKLFGYSVRCILRDTLQDATYSSLLSKMPNVGDYTQLMDTRDGQLYTVAHFADGRFWMVDNLNLGATDLTTDLTSANTNLSTTIIASTFNGWKKTSGTGTYTSAEFIPVSGTDSTSGTAYGTLYNYCAASAGTICTTSYSSNASYDLCPSGWRLPTGNTGGEFATLYANASYNTYAKMRASVANGGAAFALAGYFSSSTPTTQGSYGFYWSSTRSNNANMYILYLDTSIVYPSSNTNRSYGSSIRCILKATA